MPAFIAVVFRTQTEVQATEKKLPVPLLKTGVMKTILQQPMTSYSVYLFFLPRYDCIFIPFSLG